MAGFPSNCSHCGAAIYAQWWDRAENAYRCRVCGNLNPGLNPELAPPRQPSRALLGCLILLWGVVVLWGLWVLIGLASLPEYLANPRRFDGGETGLYGVLLAAIAVPWLILLVITLVATARLNPQLRLGRWVGGVLLAVGAVAVLALVVSNALGDESSATHDPGIATDLVIVEPRDGTVVHSQTIEVQGTAPAGSEVVWIQGHYRPDRRADVDSSGQWTMEVDLVRGDNELIFRLSGARAQRQVLVTYAP